VLAGLHPQVRLVRSSVMVGIAHAADVALHGRGLILQPTAWSSGVGTVWDLPWQPTLTYAARGITPIHHRRGPGSAVRSAAPLPACY
jgi:hypothetical protein